MNKTQVKYFLWLRDSLGVIPPSATYEEFLESPWYKGGDEE